VIIIVTAVIVVMSDRCPAGPACHDPSSEEVSNSYIALSFGDLLLPLVADRSHVQQFTLNVPVLSSSARTVVPHSSDRIMRLQENSSVAR
jgi:hypothetical protein